MSLRLLLAAVLIAGALAGCKDEPAAAPPAPLEIQADATGHYCGMQLSDHSGPKGQIHVSSGPPYWFSSVRDAIAFTRLPEEPRDIVAIYVNDMGRASNWDEPEPGTWIDARQAHFVIESSQAGGMGAPEAVPFSDRAAAEAFQAQHGGRIARLDEVPDDYVLGPVDLERQHATEVTSDQPEHTTE